MEREAIHVDSFIYLTTYRQNGSFHLLEARRHRGRWRALSGISVEQCSESVTLLSVMLRTTVPCLLR
jgi:hypothetical protein